VTAHRRRPTPDPPEDGIVSGASDAAPAAVLYS